MVIRFKVPFDNGAVRCAAGEQTGELAHSVAARLVRCGLAEEVRGNKGINHVRGQAGMSSVKRGGRAKK